MIGFESCNSRPSDVLSEDKMVKLLADMQIAESYANTNLQGGVNREKRIEMGLQILEKNNVTQQQLDSTLAWYGKNLDDYSRLFEKVDKEILKRKEKLMAEASPVIKNNQLLELWRLPDHGIISEEASQKGWIFSYDDISFEKGDRIVWSMFLPESSSMKGMIGVEYEDGSTETHSNSFGGMRNIELALQSDTAKKIRRLFGILEAGEKAKLPIFVDSLRLISEPFDSLQYANKRGQKRSGPIYSIKPKKIEKPIESINTPLENINRKDSVSLSPQKDSLSLPNRVASKTHT